jgi:hypothetical protein
VLAKQYDYVVVATGRETEARELKVWEDMGTNYQELYKTIKI